MSAHSADSASAPMLADDDLSVWATRETWSQAPSARAACSCVDQLGQRGLVGGEHALDQLGLAVRIQRPQLGHAGGVQHRLGAAPSIPELFKSTIAP